MNEIKKAVLGGIGARDETGPGHGAQRRHGGLEGFEAPFAAQAAEIGQREPVFLHKAWVHPIHADDDDFGAGCL